MSTLEEATKQAYIAYVKEKGYPPNNATQLVKYSKYRKFVGVKYTAARDIIINPPDINQTNDNVQENDGQYIENNINKLNININDEMKQNDIDNNNYHNNKPQKEEEQKKLYNDHDGQYYENDKHDENKKKYYHKEDNEEAIFQAIIKNRYNGTDCLEWKQQHELPIVICINSVSILVGRAGNDKPSIAIHNKPKKNKSIAVHKIFDARAHHLDHTLFTDKELCAKFGSNNTAMTNVTGWHIKNRISSIAKIQNQPRNGMIINWDVMKSILEERIFAHKKNDDELVDVVITIPINFNINNENINNYKRKLIKMLFGYFDVNSCSFWTRSGLSLYASNIETGVVVLSDGHCTEIVCFNKYDYDYYGDGYTQINLGKRDILKYLSKNKHKFNDNDDGMEVLFNPKLCDDPEKQKYDGIHKLIYQCIMKCDVDIRKDLFGNIVLSGINTMYDGLQDRLLKEICNLDYDLEKVIKIIAPEQRADFAWIGGSMFAEKIVNEKIEWDVTRDDYNKI